MSRRTNIQAFRERLHAFVVAAAEAGFEQSELTQLVTAARSLCDELERRRRSPRTDEQIEAVRKLLPLLSGYPAGAVIERIKARCGVGRSRAYQLRQFCESDEKWTKDCETDSPWNS